MSIPLKQLKQEIERETGVEVTNMSLYMTRLVKEEKTIKKVTHGHYMFLNN